MYYELYIDVLFLENLILDYLLLSLVGKLLKCSAGRLRRLCGAALGSAGICVLYVFSLQETPAGNLLVYVIFSTAMVKAGLNRKGWRPLGRALALLYLCTFLLGGIVQWIQRYLKFPVYSFLGLSLVSFWILSGGMGWLMRVKGREAGLVKVTLGFHGRVLRIQGLLDTGNHLYDPVFHKPVSVITEDLQRKLCAGEEVLFLQVPFHSIGEPRGLMPAFYADYLYIRKGKDQEKRVERPLIGVTKEPLSSQKEYDMILHPELLE